MINWQVVPIERWPGEETKNRQPSRFRKTVSGKNWRGEHTERTVSGVSWTKTMDLLKREMKFLEGKNILLQMDVLPGQIRNDGWIKGNSRPGGPRIILSFDSKFGPLSYPCDMFNSWQANVRAIALALEALRKVDRYGVTKRGEQYTGWKQLPAEVGGGPHAVLAEFAKMSEAEVRKDPRVAFKKAAKNAHPDAGGNGKDFARVSEAWAMLKEGH
jgi:hypothetical protein